jgi:uncharacterized protein YqhQ
MIKVAGMALQNGLLVHTSENWAAAIRGSDGAIQVASGPKPSRFALGWAGRWPLLRGVAQMADALALLPLVKRSLPGSLLPLEDPRVGAAAGAATLAAFLLRAGERKGGSGSVLVQEVGAAALALVPVAVALRGSQLARYHGAEHKTIGEYERAVSGRDGDAGKEHERCGSNLVAPLLLANLAGNVVLRRVFRRPPPGAMLLTGLLSLAAAMELFRWTTRHPETPVARALSMPGYWLQSSLTTAEPSEAQMDVGRAALGELLRLEGPQGTLAV